MIPLENNITSNVVKNVITMLNVVKKNPECSVFY